MLFAQALQRMAGSKTISYPSAQHRQRYNHATNIIKKYFLLQRDAQRLCRAHAVKGTQGDQSLRQPLLAVYLGAVAPLPRPERRQEKRWCFGRSQRVCSAGFSKNLPRRVVQATRGSPPTDANAPHMPPRLSGRRTERLQARREDVCSGEAANGGGWAGQGVEGYLVFSNVRKSEPVLALCEKMQMQCLYAITAAAA